MLKRLGLAAILVAAVLAGVHFWPDAEQPPAQAPQDIRRPSSTGEGEKTDSVSLALKAITLSQGEKGLEIWRLKASWAGMAQKDGLISVEKPRLVYYMPPDNQELHVDADTGDIDQKNQILRFVGHVSATLEDRSLTGGLLVYNGADKTMTFPEGASFHNPDMSGSANRVVWRMEDRVVEAEGDIQIEFQQSPAGILSPAPKQE